MDTVINTDKLSEETIWQAICLVTRLANSNALVTNLVECQRIAVEINERMKAEGR